MGAFFSNIHILNRRQAKPEQIEKLLRSYMEKKDLTPALKEESQFTYYVVFSKKSDWITLSSSDIDSSEIKTKTQKLSRYLKTACIGISVFDSDWAMLDMFDSEAKLIDSVVIGRADEFLDEPAVNAKGSPERWASLLAEGKTWEGLAKVWGADHVFVETALEKTAPFLGMDDENITSDYSRFEEEPNNNNNILCLRFKTAEELFIKDGPTKLRLFHQSFAVSGEEHVVSFCNLGGVSKGLTVVLIGDCFKDSGIEVSDMTVEKNVRPPSPGKQSVGMDEREVHSAKPKKYDMNDGSVMLRFDFDDFQFHEGLNMKHQSMKGKKGDDTFFSYGCHIRYTPVKNLSGKQHFRFAVIPQNNWEAGQASYKMTLYDTRHQLMKESFADFRKMEYMDGTDYNGTDHR